VLGGDDSLNYVADDWAKRDGKIISIERCANSLDNAAQKTNDQKTALPQSRKIWAST